MVSAEISLYGGGGNSGTSNGFSAGASASNSIVNHSLLHVLNINSYYT